jgi:hypothetical protein
LEQIVPDGKRYCSRFVVSALAALLSQQSLHGDEIDQYKYNGIKSHLRVQDGDDRQVLEASHIPLLMRELDHFLKNRIDRQIQEAHRELDYIITSLMDSLNQEQQEAARPDKKNLLQRRFDKALEEKLDHLKEEVEKFRDSQIGHLPTLQKQLLQVARQFCDEIDHQLKTEMPNYWKTHFRKDRIVTRATIFGLVIKEGFLGEVELNLWNQVASNAKLLAQEAIRTYKSALDMTNLPALIADQCFGCIEQESIAAQVNRGIEAMQDNLVPSMKGFALTHLVNPEHGLITFDKNGNTIPSPLLEALNPDFSQARQKE